VAIHRLGGIAKWGRAIRGIFGITMRVVRHGGYIRKLLSHTLSYLEFFV
jgi:hypothetical protein